MAAKRPQTPPPTFGQQARNFLLYGFAISVVLHFIFVPLVKMTRTTSEDEPIHKIKITQAATPTPSPTPKPTATPTPPPTPTPKPQTPPPVKQTPQPPVPKIKVNTVTSHNKSAGPVEHANANTVGQTNGLPQGTAVSAPPVASAPPVVHTAPPTPTPAPTPTPTPTPTPKPACAVPNSAQKVVVAAPVEVPSIVQQSGNSSGSVEVRVGLDAQSHIVSTSVYRSTNPLLNNAAVTATKQSTFKTAVVNCVPQSSDYLYVVEFSAQ